MLKRQINQICYNVISTTTKMENQLNQNPYKDVRIMSTLQTNHIWK